MKRCASCHQAGELGLSDWTLITLRGHDKSRPKQSDLCMECHRSHLTPEFALQAHSFDPARLAKKTEAVLASTAVASMATWLNDGNMECARCHQEHKGAGHDLTVMSVAQCSTCHAQPFQSLEQGHPDFADWPNGRRTRIVFDHRSHEAKHFPQSRQEFDCAVCHQANDVDEPTRGVSYASCAKCHDDDISRSLNESLELVRLPTIDVDVFRKERISVGEWPRQYVGEFDGSISPMLKLMLLADPSAQIALRHFGAQFDFLDVDTRNYDDVEAAADLVWAIKLFLYELSVDGPVAIVRRARRIDRDRLPKDDVAALAVGLDTRRVGALVNSLFRNLKQDLAGRQLAGTTDKVAIPEFSTSVVQSTWSYDPDGCRVSVRVDGHANRLLTSWLELATRLGPAEAPSLTQLLGPTGTGGCMSCHSLEAVDGFTALKANWISASADTSLRRPFTKFAHAPHLLQPALSDCRSCHELDTAADYLASYKSLKVNCDQWNFQPMNKSACATCHVSNGAGDNCTKCHNYHVH